MMNADTGDVGFDVLGHGEHSLNLQDDLWLIRVRTINENFLSIYITRF